MYTDLILGLKNSIQPLNLLIMTFALTGGILVGALPGLTATMAVALLVPITFGMDPASGLLMLGAVYCGGVFGGSISAILLNIPGTPSAVCTTFDGYPLTKQGRADEALNTALVSSVIGGIVGTLVLLFLAFPLAKISLKFGPPEFFWLAIFGLTIISALAAEDLLKGCLGGVFGLLMATVGIDPVNGFTRFTFGYQPLAAGISPVAALIGFLCMSQVFVIVENNKKYIADYSPKKGSMKKVLLHMIKKCKVNVLMSSIIGSFVGMLPGAGGNIASFVAYGESKRWSKEPDKFGTGILDGIVASESANNATVSSSLIPLVSLGIPGSPVAAMLLGGLLIHGMRPGAKLFIETGEVAYTFIIGLFFANLLMLFVGYFGMRFLARSLSIPSHYIATAVVVLAIMGSFAIRNSLIDVYVMIITGLIGYIFIKTKIHLAPVALGLILGAIAEKGFASGLFMAKSQGSILSVFFLRPIVMVLIALSLLAIITPIINNKRTKKRKEQETICSNS